MIKTPIICVGLQSCGSGMFIPTKEEGEIKIFCSTSFNSHNIHKIEHHFIFEQVKKKVRASLQKMKTLFTQKIVTKLSKTQKYAFGIWDLEKTYSGSRIRISNTVGLELIF
jgi:hypothetical protein